MPQTHYSFRSGHSIKGIEPQLLGEWLEQLRKAHGALTPEIVRNEAVDPTSPGHNAFEWDDSVAAEHHRLSQARRLITSIRVINPPTGKPVIAYVSVKVPETGRSYIPTVDALNDEVLKERVLIEVQTYIEALQRRYSGFAEVVALLDAMKQKVG